MQRLITLTLFAVFLELAGSASTLALAQGATDVRPAWRLPTAKSVQVMGHSIAYYEKGAGPTLLLVHGLSGSAALEWGRVLDTLAENHRVVAPYQIGFAPSEQPELSYDTATFVNHLAGFIRALELRDVTLVGESFGGWVVATYAAEMSRAESTLPSISKLVIVDGALLMKEGEASGNPEAALPVDPVVRAESAEFVREHPFGDNQRTIGLLLQNSGLGKGLPTQGDLAYIRMPTLVIWGGKDLAVPLSVGERIAQSIVGAQLSVIASSGHVPSIEAPNEFARVLLEFASKP